MTELLAGCVKDSRDINIIIKQII